jgi:RNA polymerase sigma factor (sigma-70 family)
MLLMAMAGEQPIFGEPADASFETLFAADERRLFAIAFSILRDPGEAQDAVQETALIGWRRWTSLRDRASARAWLAKICVHHCIRRKRHLLRWFTVDTSAKELRAAADRYLQDGGRFVEIDRAYARLSVRQRAVVSLHYHHGYTLVECADLMGCSPGSVSQHLARALRLLRQELSDG